MLYMKAWQLDLPVMSCHTPRPGATLPKRLLTSCHVLRRPAAAAAGKALAGDAWRSLLKGGLLAWLHLLEVISQAAQQLQPHFRVAAVQPTLHKGCMGERSVAAVGPRSSWEGEEARGSCAARAAAAARQRGGGRCIAALTHAICPGLDGGWSPGAWACTRRAGASGNDVLWKLPTHWGQPAWARAAHPAPAPTAQPQQSSPVPNTASAHALTSAGRLLPKPGEDMVHAWTALCRDSSGDR